MKTSIKFLKQYWFPLFYAFLALQMAAVNIFITHKWDYFDTAFVGFMAGFLIAYVSQKMQANLNAHMTEMEQSYNKQVADFEDWLKKQSDPLHSKHYRGQLEDGQKFVHCPKHDITSWNSGDYDNQWCHACKVFFKI